MVNMKTDQMKWLKCFVDEIERSEFGNMSIQQKEFFNSFRHQFNVYWQMVVDMETFFKDSMIDEEITISLPFQHAMDIVSYQRKYKDIMK